MQLTVRDIATVLVLRDQARDRPFLAAMAGQLGTTDENALTEVRDSSVTGLIRDCGQCRNHCLYLLSPWQGWDKFWLRLRLRLLALASVHAGHGDPAVDSAAPARWAP